MGGRVNIVAGAWLFRLGIAADLITFAIDVVLIAPGSSRQNRVDHERNGNAHRQRECRHWSFGNFDLHSDIAQSRCCWCHCRSAALGTAVVASSKGQSS